MSTDVLRNLSLLVPLVLVLAVLVAARARLIRIDTAAVAGAVLGGLLALVGVLAVEHATSWWTFAPAPTSALGIPMEAALGWALVWGALPGLVGGPVWLWVLGLGWVDLLLMPRLEPLVVLETGWWRGEILLLVAVALPAVTLALLTRRSARLGVRVGLQMLTFGGLVLWLLPTIALRHADRQWSSLVDHGLPVRTALLVAAVVAAVPALSAVVELARIGGGTPFPWDPPRRLVTTGPYAYVANPMQWGATALLLVLGLGSGAVELVAAAAIAVVFCLVLADRHEDAVLAARWPAYRAYRGQVRAWIPRWRPARDNVATLWVSEECGTCQATGGAVQRAAPTGLRLRPAESAGITLTRMRWVAEPTGDEPVVEPLVERGVAALARALEHTVLPVAWLCWLVRLPGLVHALQIVADACGLGPRPVGTRHTPGDPA